MPEEVDRIIESLRTRWQKLKTLPSKAITFGVTWVGRLALATVGTAIVVAVVNRSVVNRIFGPSEYKIYMIGDFTDQRLGEAWQEFEKLNQEGIKIEDVPVTAIRESVPEKDAGEFSSRLSKKDDTLMVVGHFNSTSAKAALVNYMNAEPPVPVILPSETNPDLVPKDFLGHYRPVFRLSPMDDSQARRAARFMLERNATNVWVIEDATGNPVYSHFLASEFVRQMHLRYRKENGESTNADVKRRARRDGGEANSGPPNEQQNKPHGRIVLWTKNIDPPSKDLLTGLGIDWVFFAGSPEACLLAIHQVAAIWEKALDKDTPKILLGNWCVSDYFIKEGAGDVRKLHTYLTYDLHADASQVEGGYALRGKKALSIVKALISIINEDGNGLAQKHGDFWLNARRILGWHWVVDARSMLSSAMEHAIENEISFTVNRDNEKTEQVVFDRHGVIAGRSFHVWRAKPPDPVGTKDRRVEVYAQFFEEEEEEEGE